MKKLFTLFSLTVIIHGTSFSSEKDNNNFFGVPEGAPFKLIHEACSKMQMRDLSPEEKEAMKKAYTMELKKRGFDEYGLTPLTHAIIKEKEKKKIKVEELLANGASVNAGNFLDFTPLHYAAAEGDIEMINILSKYKPNVNAQEANGQTPLHKAKDGKTVKCLLSLGAAIIKDNDLKTPLHRKILCKNMYNTFDAIEELIASGKENLDAISELDSPLGIAIGVNDLEVMKMLIKAGANVNKRGKDLTPLRKAVSLKRIAMVQYLLSNGANVNDGIVKGTTPLHLAVKSKNKELCQLLCNAGADTTIKDEESRTPFDLALEHWQ